MTAPADAAEPSAIGLQGEHDVVAHGEVFDDALALAVFRRVGDPLAQGETRSAEALASAGDGDLAAVGTVDTGEQSRHFGATGAEQSGEADDLSLADGQVEWLNRALAPDTDRIEVGDFVQVFAGDSASLALEGVENRKLLADHLVHQLDPQDLLGEVLPDERTIAQNGEAVGDLVDLVEKVRDEEDGDAIFFERLDHPKQFGDLVRVETGCRLVKNEHLGIDIGGAGNRDELLHGERV